MHSCIFLNLVVTTSKSLRASHLVWVYPRTGNNPDYILVTFTSPSICCSSATCSYSPPQWGLPLTSSCTRQTSTALLCGAYIVMLWSQVFINATVGNQWNADLHYLDCFDLITEVEGKILIAKTLDDNRHSPTIQFGRFCLLLFY